MKCAVCSVKCAMCIELHIEVCKGRHEKEMWRPSKKQIPFSKKIFLPPHVMGNFIVTLTDIGQPSQEYLFSRIHFSENIDRSYSEHQALNRSV